MGHERLERDLQTMAADHRRMEPPSDVAELVELQGDLVSRFVEAGARRRIALQRPL